MASEKITAMIDEIKALSVLELKELVDESARPSASPQLQQQLPQQAAQQRLSQRRPSSTLL